MMHDPNAPWNEVEIVYKDCPDCDGHGFIGNFKNGFICDTCDGTGDIARTDEDDLDDEEIAAEEKMDSRRQDGAI